MGATKTEDLIDKIIKIQERTGKTQFEMAIDLKITPSTYGNWINRKFGPSRLAKENISNYLKLNAHFLK